MTIKEASLADIEVLTDLFWNYILAHPEYISHGEIQMGVGAALNTPAPNGKQMWRQYIHEKITSDSAAVYICLTANDISLTANENAVMGFTVVDIEEDGADPFGMLCDLLVLEPYRRQGVGQTLMDAAYAWFDRKGIADVYLESGKDNHSAHAFFEKRGFSMVSHIYRRK